MPQSVEIQDFPKSQRWIPKAMAEAPAQLLVFLSNPGCVSDCFILCINLLTLTHFITDIHLNC